MCSRGKKERPTQGGLEKGWAKNIGKEGGTKSYDKGILGSMGKTKPKESSKKVTGKIRKRLRAGGTKKQGGKIGCGGCPLAVVTKERGSGVTGRGGRKRGVVVKQERIRLDERGGGGGVTTGKKDGRRLGEGAKEKKGDTNNKNLQGGKTGANQKGAMNLPRSKISWDEKKEKGKKRTERQRS